MPDRFVKPLSPGPWPLAPVCALPACLPGVGRGWAPCAATTPGGNPPNWAHGALHAHARPHARRRSPTVACIPLLRATDGSAVPVGELTKGRTVLAFLRHLG